MKPYRVYVDKFYNVLNVNNDALIVMCVVPDGLLTDFMAIRGLAWKLGNYIWEETTREL